jgi:hypothetical protein
MQSLSDDLLRMILILVPQGDRCHFMRLFSNPKWQPGNAMTDLHVKDRT